MLQDVMSTAFDSYDGLPRWLIDKLSPAHHAYPWPFQHKFEPQEWALSYLTEAVGTAFQQLYDNEAGARDAMTSFWTKIASVFVNHASILGYEV
jgi:endoglycosylceramidase